MIVNERGILATFDRIDACLEAIRSLRREGLRRFTVFSPVPHHEIEDVLERRRSRVPFFTLVGGILGCASGFGLAAWTSHRMGLVTGGKPIISVPPFIIVAFEMLILFGALFTLLGLLWQARIGKPRVVTGFREGFTADRFGILVEEGRPEVVRRILEDARAETIEETVGEGGLR